MNIGKRIKERRKALGMSADEMGAKLGKDRSTIYRYEKGDIENLPLEILEPIAKILQTTPGYIMGWEEVKKNNDALTDIVVKLRTDANFAEVVKGVSQLSPEQLASVKQVVDLFLKGN